MRQSYLTGSSTCRWSPVPPWRSVAKPMLQKYTRTRAFLSPLRPTSAPPAGAEVGRVRVAVALDVMQRSVVRAEAHRRVVPWPASEIGDHQVSADQDEGRQRDAQERMK